MITESPFARETFLWGQCLLGEQRRSSCSPFLGGTGLLPDCCHSERKLQLGQPLKEAAFSHSSLRVRWEVRGWGCSTFFHALNSYFWKGKSMLFTSLSMYGQILFLTDFRSERITKPPRDTSLETLPWSLCPVWASVIGCCNLQVRLLQWPSHHGWASMAGKVEQGRPPHCHQQPCWVLNDFTTIGWVTWPCWDSIPSLCDMRVLGEL